MKCSRIVVVVVADYVVAGMNNLETWDLATVAAAAHEERESRMLAAGGAAK